MREAEEAEEGGDDNLKFSAHGRIGLVFLSIFDASLLAVDKYTVWKILTTEVDSFLIFIYENESALIVFVH